MKSTKTDPFFEQIGEYLGVEPNKIFLEPNKIPGKFNLVGPRPTRENFEFPQLRSYCFYFVLKLHPPLALCLSYQQEYNDLKATLERLIEDELWAEVAEISQRLEELKNWVDSTCKVRELVIQYCIFDWFEDPFLGGREFPPSNPIPPLEI